MQTKPVIQKKPIEYVKMVFRRKWLLIIPTVIGLIGGIITADSLPKIYRASTLILVEEGRVVNPLIEGLAVTTSVASRLGTLRAQILGWDRLTQLISTLNLAKDVKNQEELEALIGRLRSHIRVDLQSRNTKGMRNVNNVISISYEGKDPAEDMTIVKTITDIFIAENLRLQNSEAENAIAFINDELALYQKKLKQSDIAGMEEKLNNLLLDSTEKHPMVIELKKQITAAKTELAQGKYDVNAAAIASSQEELNGLKKELQDMRKDLATSTLSADKGGENRSKLTENTNEKLYKLLLLERVENVAKQDSGVNQRLYNELLSRLETAKITQRLEASQERTRYTVLDPARLPLKPIKPNKILILFAGMICGMCAGIGLVAMAELFDHSLLGVDEAKSYLELPILGAISQIVTETDVAAKKIRRMKIAGISIVTGIVLLVVIIFNVILGG